MSAALETRLPTTPHHAPPTHASGSSTGRRAQLALVLLVSAQFVVMLDTSIVNVALPSIQSNLGLTPTGTTWVVNAYVLAFGGLLLLSGRAADLLGRRRMFVVGSALFAVGTLVSAAATGQGVLVGGRIIQGVGAAALSPAAMSLLLLSFPGAARARAMGLWGAASTLGGATGVMAGGLLVGSFGWSSVFSVTVPVSLAAVVLARRVLPEDVRGARRPFDWYGSAAVTGAVVALVHATLGLADHGVVSVPVLGGLVVSMALLWAFVVIERRAADPLVPMELLRSRPLDAGVVLAVLGGAARASTFVLVALYLQQVLSLAPRQAGFAMVPTSVTGFAVSLALLPRLLRALGPHRTLVGGMVVLAAGLLWLANAPAGAGYVAAVLPGLLMVATGVALSFTPTTMVIASTVPSTHTGLASGLAGSATQVGAALGTAAFTAIGLAVAHDRAGTLSAAGFGAAFTAAAMVSLATALVGGFLVAGARRRSGSTPAAPFSGSTPAAPVSGPTPAAPVSRPRRSVGVIVTGSFATGVVLAVLLVAAPFIPAQEPRMAGAGLVGLAIGWAMVAVLTTRFTDQPQRWAIAPAAFMGVGGLLLIAGGRAASAVLEWVWPPALLALVVWMVVQVRRHLSGPSRRWLMFPVLGILALASIGGGYQTVGAAIAAGANPLTGQLVDVGGHRLHLSCTGSGSPTVVVQPGGGEFSSNWAWISPALARDTRVCVYDRAGRGWSEPADVPQDGAAVAAELHTLLQRAHVPGPYVLAGHSFGGLYTVTFAALYPDEVAGMVLVDSTAPAWQSPASPAASTGGSYDLMARLSALAATSARVGLTRLYASVEGGSLPAGARDAVRASIGRPETLQSTIDEFAQAGTSARQAAALTTFGAKPLAVLTAGTGSAPDWFVKQDRLAALSTNTQHRIIDGATHQDLIADEADAATTTQAIRDVVSAVRTGAPVSR